MFYFNLDYKDEIIPLEGRKQPIYLTLEEFTEICNLPWTNSLCKLDEIEVDEEFNYVNATFSFPAKSK